VADALRSKQLHDPPRIFVLATSMSTSGSISRERLLSGNGEPLCKYRKGFFDHYKPKAFIVSTLRVAIQQGTLILANFMSDQLEGELKRNKAVEDGKMSQGEADEEAKEWEKLEWEKRWKVFPNRFFTAFAKFHVIALFMRTYELLASRKYDDVVLDKLTMDPFHASKKTASASSDKSAVAKEMFHTTFWANTIAFMADYSVHQIILCYGYYAYVRRKREERKSQQSQEEAIVVDAAVLTSMLRKSTQLFVSRVFGLTCSAIGGAVGTLWWPGWGAVLLSNMGEGAASVVMDDGQPSASQPPKED